MKTHAVVRWALCAVGAFLLGASLAVDEVPVAGPGPAMVRRPGPVEVDAPATVAGASDPAGGPSIPATETPTQDLASEPLGAPASPLLADAPEDVRLREIDRWRCARLPVVRRHRLVRIDPATFVEGEVRRLDLFDGRSVRVLLASSRPASGPARRLWSGRVLDEPGGTMTIVAGSSAVAGELRLAGGEIFEVRCVEGPVHSLREIDPSAGPLCAACPAGR